MRLAVGHAAGSAEKEQAEEDEIKAEQQAVTVAGKSGPSDDEHRARESANARQKREYSLVDYLFAPIPDWVSALAACVGVWLLFRTVRATDLTLKQAMAATGVARDTLKATVDIGRAQVRAYISIVEGRYCVATDIIDCNIKLRNSGQSVGIVQSVEAVLTGLTSRTTEHGLRVTQEKITSTYALPVAIPAGGEEAIALGWHEGMTEDGFGWLETDAANRINITVTIVFRDVFGETFTVHGYLRPASPDSKFEAARREAITEGRLYSYNHPKDEKGSGPAA